MTMTIQILSK